MAITYPLNTPTNLGIANIVLSAENAVAISQSPFTFQQQIVAHPGQRWAASVSLPPMKRQDAEYWVAFLLSLKGQVGTFLLGDPNCVDAQGSATAKRNLLTFTEQFDNAAWVKSNCAASANTTASPVGTLTADTLTANAGLSFHYAYVASAPTVTGAYTYSVYVKKGTSTWIFLTVTNSSINYFNLDTGLFGTAPDSPTATPLADGWFRITVTKTLSAQNLHCGIGIAGGNGLANFTAVGTETLIVWGAQAEAGSTATAYQAVADAYGPFVNGDSQIGDTLVIDGCSPSVTGFLLPGDYIQLGNGAATQLYKVLTQVDTDATGGATLDIWPDLRSSPPDNDPVVVVNTKGRFRLKDNVQQWQINNISSYGITFDCVEAI